MKAKELRELSPSQIENLIKDLDKEKFELKNEMAISRKLEQPHKIKEKRRLKARAKTILTEKAK